MNTDDFSHFDKLEIYPIFDGIALRKEQRNGLVRKNCFPSGATKAIEQRSRRNSLETKGRLVATMETKGRRWWPPEAPGQPVCTYPGSIRPAPSSDSDQMAGPPDRVARRSGFDDPVAGTSGATWPGYLRQRVG